MFGRAAETRAVGELLAAACEGAGGVLVLRGEAGIGKSALLRHAAGLAAEPGRDGAPMRVLSCAGVESEVEYAFSGLLQLLRPVLGHLGELPAVQAEALRGALGLGPGTASDFLVAAAVLGLLGAAAAERPLLVLVDDLQWLDRASAAALLFAARRLPTEPVAVLLAVREPAAAAVDTSDLPARRLEGLDAADAARLLAEAGWTAAPPLREAVLAASGGNPLALIELAGLGGSGGLAELPLTGTLPVGDRVRTAFARRARALPPDSRELLLVAAAEETGRTATVTGAAARLGLPPGALEPAERSGLVELAGPELRFRHPLVRSAVYADAPADRRRAAHLAVAGQLAADGAGDRAAWHRALAATAPDEALAEELERGAETARRRGGEAAAASVLRRAAALSTTAEGRRRRTVAAAFVALESGQPDLARTLVGEVMAEPVPAVTLAQLTGTVEMYSGDPAVAAASLIRCGELMADDDPEEAAWTFMLAAGAAFQSGDLRRTDWAVRRIAGLDCSPATRTAGLGMAGALEGRVSGAELWELPAALAASQTETGGRPWMWAAIIGWLGPDQRLAARLAEAAGQVLRATGARASLTELLYYQADIEFRLGRWPEGLRHAEEGLHFSRETGQRGWTASLLALLARYAAVRGAAAQCRACADDALALAVPMRHRLAAAVAASSLGLLALGEGDPEAAFAALTGPHFGGAPLGLAHVPTGMVPDLVEAAMRTGRADTAREVVDDYAAWVEAGTGPLQRALLDQCRALAADDGSAEEFHRAAVAGADAQQRPFAAARAALRYGEWLRRARRPAEAREPLRSAFTVLDRLGAEPWARRARLELAAAGGTAHRLDPAARLSPQERAVARLAAAGYSNREIAERLYLSPRTVGSHLYRMFPKLGIGTRSQLRELDLD
ncbi:helix-turn-helix transcriptional regulator [Allonocardiopsis opalescens]|nr:helix-turn-helix transcriptional regulator [Allonocardiopsis opalescens]